MIQYDISLWYNTTYHYDTIRHITMIQYNYHYDTIQHITMIQYNYQYDTIQLSIWYNTTITMIQYNSNFGIWSQQPPFNHASISAKKQKLIFENKTLFFLKWKLIFKRRKTVLNWKIVALEIKI